MKLPLFHNMKLFKKFVLTYCILLIIPVLIISSYAYANLSNIITDNFLNSASESFEQSLDYEATSGLLLQTIACRSG